MLSETDEIMQAFRGTALDGQPVTQEPDSDVLLVEWTHPDNLLPAWRAARSMTDTTGRWPLFLASECAKGSPFFVSSEDLAATLALPTTRDVVEQCAFDPSLLSQLLDPSGVAMPSRYAEWFVPEGVHLALLPTSRPWLPMAVRRRPPPRFRTWFLHSRP